MRSGAARRGTMSPGSMDGARAHFDEFCDPSRGEEAHSGALSAIADALRSARASAPELRIVALIAELQAYLTSTDDFVRERGTLLIGHIVDEAIFPVSEEEAAVLFTFLTARFDDFPSLGAALLAMKAVLRVAGAELGGMGKFSELCDALAKQRVGNLNQRIRQSAQEILSLLVAEDVARHLDLEQLGTTLADISEGERDPRCLLAALQNFARLLELAERAHGAASGAYLAAVQRAFDTVNVYFPISFTAPKRNVHNVTKVDLRQALHGVLVRPGMAARLLPLVASKLETTNGVDTRKDAASTFAEAVAAFDLEELQAGTALHGAIDMLEGIALGNEADLELRSAAAGALGSLARKFEPAPPAAYAAVVAPVVGRCATNLDMQRPGFELGSSKFKHSYTLLQEIARQGPRGLRAATKEALPHLLRPSGTDEETAVATVAMLSLVKAIDERIDYSGSAHQALTQGDAERIFDHFWRVMQVAEAGPGLDALRESSACVAMEGASQLLARPPTALVSAARRNELAGFLVRCALKGDEGGGAPRSATEALAQVCRRLDPASADVLIVAPILDVLDRESLRALCVMERLSSDAALFSKLCSRVIRFAVGRLGADDAVLALRSATRMVEGLVASVAPAAAAEALLDLVEERAEGRPAYMILLEALPAHIAAARPALVRESAALMARAVSCWTDAAAKCDAALKVRLDGASAALIALVAMLVTQVPPPAAAGAAAVAPEQAAAHVDAVALAALPLLGEVVSCASAAAPVFRSAEYVLRLVGWLVECAACAEGADREGRLQICLSLAALLNRVESAGVLESACASVLASGDTALLGAAVRGIMPRCDSNAHAEAYETLLGGAAAGSMDAADGISFLCSRRRHGEKFSPFFHQKLFATSIDKLRGAAEESIGSALRACSSLMTVVALPVLKARRTDMLRLCNLALPSEAEGALRVLQLFLADEESREDVLGHAVLAGKCLAVAQGDARAKARHAALVVLEAMCSPAFVAQQAAIVKGLARCLDDRKRVVRQQAVRTRNKWVDLS